MLQRYREFRGKECVAEGIRWEGGEMRQRHREIGGKGCVADGMGIFYKNGTNF